MPHNTFPLLSKLPIEIVYRILNKFDTLTILCSCLNACQRLNTIIETYQRYRVDSDKFQKVVIIYKFIFYTDTHPTEFDE